MKKTMRLFVLLVVAICTLAFTPSCVNAAHTHDFSLEVVSDDYFAADATCTSPATYYYSCSCGEKGTSTFEYGDMLEHIFIENTDEKNLAFDAQCAVPARYYYSCEICGQRNFDSIFYSGDIEPNNHYCGRTVDYVFANDESYKYVVTCDGCAITIYETELLSICHTYENDVCVKCNHEYKHENLNDDLHCLNAENICVGCGFGCNHSIDNNTATCTKCGTFFWGHLSTWVDGKFVTYKDRMQAQTAE